MEERDLAKKVLEEYKKGNICYRTIEGVFTQKIEDFVKQPLEGMLYDINRDRTTVHTFLDDPKWTNDFALTVLLEHYYNKCKKLEDENKHLQDELTKSIPIPQYKEGDVCVNEKGEEVTIVAIVADQYKFDCAGWPYKEYEFFRPFEHMYKKISKDE